MFLSRKLDVQLVGGFDERIASNPINGVVGDAEDDDVSLYSRLETQAKDRELEVRVGASSTPA